MANNTIDVLDIELKADSSKTTKQLDNVIGKLNSLSKAVDKVGATKGINKLKTSLNSLANMPFKNIASKIHSTFKNIKGSISKEVGTLKGTLGTGLTRLANIPIEPTANIFGKIDNKFVGGLEKAIGGITNTFAKVGDIWANGVDFKGILSNMLGGIGNVLGNLSFSSIGSALKSVGKVILNVGSTALKATGSVAKFIGKSALGGLKRVASKCLAPLKQFHKTFSKLGSTFARVLTYKAISAVFQAVNSAVSKGINNLYQYSTLMGGTFAKSMDTLATSFQYFSNSIAAMIAPIINNLAPILDAIIDKLVDMINLVNQFFSALTGKTWTKAKKQATKYAESVSSASDKLKGSLASFDEINNIGKDDSSSSGSNADYGSMFEEATIDTQISDFAQKIKDAFNSGDWQELGSLLGNKFNDIFNSIDWEGIGTKVGYGLNGVIATLASLVDTIDWYNISAKFSLGFNNILKEVDFTNLGSLLVSKITVIGDMIIGAFENIDWGLVGTSFKDLLVGAFNKLSSFFDKYDWGKLGSELWNNLKKLVNGLDFTSIAKSFFTLFGKALGAAVSFVGSFIKGIGTDIVNYFKQYINIDENDSWLDIGINVLKGVLEGIVKGLGNIVEWIRENVFTPIVDGFKSLFGIHSPSTVMEELGGYIVDGFMNGFDTFKNIGDKVKEWSSKVVEWFTGGKDGKNIVERFKDKASDIVSGFKSKISTTYTNTKDAVTTWADKTKTWFSDKVNNTTWGKYASDTISGFKDKISGSYTSVKSSITTWGSNVKTWFTSDVNRAKFYNVASDVIEGFKNGIGSLYYSTYSAIHSWASSVSKWFKSILGVHSPSRVFYGIGEYTIEGFNNSINDLGGTSKKVMENWGNSIISATPDLSTALDTSSLANNVSSLSGTVGINSNGELTINDDTTSETNSLLVQLINQVGNINMQPYITVKDVGKASVKYINQQSRILGNNLI